MCPGIMGLSKMRSGLAALEDRDSRQDEPSGKEHLLNASSLPGRVATVDVRPT